MPINMKFHCPNCNHNQDDGMSSYGIMSKFCEVCGDNVQECEGIIESKIEYATPPGSNGETEFDDVMRKMLPSNSGFPISNIESEGEINFNWETTINNTWNKDRLETIIYVQHTNSKEVFQTKSTIH